MSNYNPRYDCPSRDNKYYNSGINPYVNAGYGMFQNNGNCTAYAYGRFMEILGQDRCNLSVNDAEDFFDHSDEYERGQTPRLGAIICWEGKGSLAGHVAVVEEIKSDGTIVTSNSAWQSSLFYLKELKPPYNMGSNYRFQGFIYNPNVKDYKIKYRAHVQSEGWQDWKHDGETAGTTAKSLRMEAIQIDAPFEVRAKAHIQEIGWKDYGIINKDTIIGTTGQSKRLECLCLKGDFKYRVYLQYTGWTCWTNADGICTLGSVGQRLRIEAIEIMPL